MACEQAQQLSNCHLKEVKMVVGQADNCKQSERKRTESRSCDHKPQPIHHPFASIQQRCARWMIPGKTELTNSTSSAVDARPSEKRTNPLAASGRPIAVITWLGSNEPAEQAEPLDAQMPSMSKPAKRAIPSVPLTVKERVLGRQPAAGETTVQPEIWPITDRKRLVSSGKGASKKTGFLTKNSKAVAKP